MMKITVRMLSIAALLSILGSLAGCSKTLVASDIRSVSISCGHMDNSCSYAFYLRKEENGWLLDAEFAEDSELPRTEYEACPVAEEDVLALFELVQKQDVIKRLERYRKPKLKIHVLDDTTYYTSILFEDGETLGAATMIDQDIEAYFYRLAKKYAGAAPAETKSNFEEE